MKIIIKYCLVVFFISFNLTAGNVKVFTAEGVRTTDRECSILCNQLKVGATGTFALRVCGNICTCDFDVTLSPPISRPSLPPPPSSK